MEVNFDGIVGTTHHYGGLSYGNVASTKSGLTASNPKQAALQGLSKMKALHDLGIPQAVLPPHERPDIEGLRDVGFSGTDSEVLSAAAKHNPRLLSLYASSSPMWTANAATVSPAGDTADGRLHLTPANLISKVHRSIEARATMRILRAIFIDPEYFRVHEPLPATDAYSDEGAANHGRLATGSDTAGVELFVYGQTYLDSSAPKPKRFPARQTLEASQSIARRHGLDPSRTVFTQQNPDAIDAGVFHNDVISVCHEDVFLYHEEAFVDSVTLVDDLHRTFAEATGARLQPIRIAANDLALEQAVSSYLFNSQIVTRPDGAMALIAPTECKEMDEVASVINRVIADDNPISEVHYLDVRQSMRNGGGPACLRLRVAMTAEQRDALGANVLFTDELHRQLTAWIERHYRDTLTLDDLADPALLSETRAALDALTQILQLGSVYPFQR